MLLSGMSCSLPGNMQSSSAKTSLHTTAGEICIYPKDSTSLFFLWHFVLSAKKATLAATLPAKEQKQGVFMDVMGMCLKGYLPKNKLHYECCKLSC